MEEDYSHRGGIEHGWERIDTDRHGFLSHKLREYNELCRGILATNWHRGRIEHGYLTDGNRLKTDG